ncbi:ADP-ribosylglycohydrolase family protein [Pseudohongiella spirulinae]|uniref:ADP-ribosyl-glycohydrolase superfamily protein n=1 Tax=Pseudohongiella spirulinae TaxID=1249552 RepID=A0A0S2KGN2_9GAMM|nr:ADP-ribosylglycohydrolase family protein [Pseudohongiella spirulinae]ALO47469.1 ADP-ribosyl-glycohydrolase superfamily protein [Pseudohongiella spirulinae]
MHTLSYQRSAAALRTLFVADALAMPVHWYYSVADIFRAFPGGIQRLEAAPARHPSSIMSLHSTAGGGRHHGKPAPSRQEVVGTLILKGRHEFWNQRSIHYHQGMQAGENTLNAHCARVLMRCLAANGGEYKPQAFLQDYIAFMTADPPQHNDTYAESYHRGFFANLQRGLPPERCAAITHDTPSIGGLVTIAPLVLSQRIGGIGLDTVRSNVQTHLSLTHPDALLAQLCDAYVVLIDQLLSRDLNTHPQEIIADIASASIGLNLPRLIASQPDDREVIGRRFSSACYIDGAWPGVLYLLYKYYDKAGQALLANTNLGGDNVHRGAVLGALLGLIGGQTIEAWYTQLHDHAAIDSEIQRLLTEPSPH